MNNMDPIIKEKFEIVKKIKEQHNEEWDNKYLENCYKQIPESYINSINEYLYNRKELPIFLYFLFTNDFEGIMTFGNETELSLLKNFHRYLVFEVPNICRGSSENYINWISNE